MRVPPVVRWPGRVKPGASNALVSHMDFLASFGAWLGGAARPAQPTDSEDVMAVLLWKGVRTPRWPIHLATSVQDRFLQFAELAQW
jgi:arylsulfatase A-like enzyme